ncbi:MAG: response regulator [Gammaproteobacteria bacterium]|jgi:CheY-like chemotaxis protein/glycine cleavage system H lipoate-binding protein|nr:response regulator [Gammaproteobacteria bacterium]
MKTTLLTIVLPALILFFFLNLAAREMFLRLQEKKKRADREEALADSLRLDFTRESKTLRRVEVKDPVARILCVDDEEVILNSFRKILVLDGYSIDTVETGQEALGLVRMHDYDFVFTDLKMPAMSGTDVAKSVKHLRPDIDVVIITGFATVESAVECMKHGVMDYVEKPFTEDELRVFVRHALIKRRDRIEKQLKPKVHVASPAEIERSVEGEFSIPGGVLISSGHCWASLAEDGTARIGLDDFAKKLLGSIDTIDFPNIGMKVKAGEPLFSVNQGHRRARFHAPLSGKVVKVNEDLKENWAMLEETPFGESWVCVIEGDDLDTELPQLKIGKSAVAFIQEDIDRFQAFAKQASNQEEFDPATLRIGAIESLDDAGWEASVKQFFGR